MTSAFRPLSGWAVAASVLAVVLPAALVPPPALACPDDIAPVPATVPAPAAPTQPSPPQPTHPAPEADRLMARGAESFRHGAFAEAIEAWRQSERAYAAAGRTDGRCDALSNLAAAYQAKGQYAEAGAALHTALPLAGELHDVSRSASLLAGLGSLYTFIRQWDEADRALGRGLSIARDAGNAADRKATALLLNNLGTLRTFQERPEDAQQAYGQAAAAAGEAGEAKIRAEALANAALAAARAGAADQALALNRTASAEAGKLGDGHAKAVLLLTVGQTFERARGDNGQAPSQRTLRREAFDAYRAAEEAGDAAGDRLSASYALGYTGHLYEAEGRVDEALQLTRRAAFLAQAVQSPHALYRWQWQTGRLLAAKGETEAAIRSYTAAAETLRPIQNDLTLGYGNQGPSGSFREAVAPVYYELADLLLRRADGIGDGNEVDRLLRDARQTVEQLKTGELQDFFQDPCVNLLKAKAKPVEAVGGRTAVVYLIPLADRTEILVGLGSDIHRVKVPVAADALVKEVREFRTRLEDRTTNRYLRNARQLYNWLVRPIEPMLQSARVDTLVFVPDGALRTVPMAALNDGSRFLVAKYAVAVTPGLTLMEPRPTPRTNTSVLEAGLSVQVLPEFPPLEYVSAEIESVNRIFGGGSSPGPLLNERFTRPNLQRELREREFSVVHIASHGEFSGDVRRTFLLAYDGKVTLDQLQSLIQPSRFREKPLELLTLSACQTAAGDDRAALGLAGVAIKAGARSAVATLWSVNDEAAEQVVTTFYAELRRDPTVSKAKAMQRAQVKLLSDSRYRHAFYWSPYLVIGNWL